MLQGAPPKANELEVTLFGPGYGESIAIHADGEWLIIDSCINPATKRPAAQDYLEGIGVDPAAVKLLACTHWHDDHYKGLAALYKAYPNASLCMSAALQSDEFLTLMTSYEGWHEDSAAISSGMNEIARVFDMARQLDRTPQFAIGDRRIWYSGSGSAELYSLSPSDEMLKRAFVQFAAMMPQRWTEKRRASIASPNHVAVAMHLRWGEHSVLLGSDLEEHGDSTTGWSAVIASKTRPRSIASLYKVSHHGSETGEHSELWKQLVTMPISIVTPFSRGRRPLPAEIDRIRLKSTSSKVHLTADFKDRSVRRTGALGKMIRNKAMRLVQTTFGVVRCRLDTSAAQSTWRVENYGDASTL